jgi:uncharacterized delta-60 repeat protein
MTRALGLIVASALVPAACGGGSGGPQGLRLDPEFGDGGRSVIALSKGNDLPSDAALQPDGKVVVAGLADNEFGLARFDEKGRLDTGFGHGGVARLAVGRYRDSPDAIQAVGVQPDGKIVGAGGVEGLSFTIVRFTHDGQLDPTFGGDGRIDWPTVGGPTSNGDFHGTHARGVAFDNRGRILVTGIARTGAAFVARLTSAGGLDKTFGADGVVFATRGGYLGGTPGPPLIEPDGSVVVPVSVGRAGVRLKRYRDDGEHDTAFGDPYTTLLRRARSIARNSAGGFIVAGYFEGDQSKCLGSCAVPAVVRFSPDGSLDRSFGDGGRALVAPEAESFEHVAVGSRGGRAVAATSAVVGLRESDFLVRPLTESGLGEETKTSMASGEQATEQVAAVLIRPDGRVIVVGAVEKGVGKYGAVLFSPALAQYRND